MHAAEDGAWRGRLAVLAAFGIVYLVWGSTFLVIRIAVHDVPPGLLAGIRFVLAGVVLGVAALALGQPLPRSPRAWWVIFVMAIALVVLGNGFVTWGEQWVPSNQTALLVASSALWTAWFGTFGRSGTPMSRGGWTGLLIGFLGVVLMIWPDREATNAEVWALAAILASAVSWSAGMIYGRSAGVGVRPLMLAAMQMLVGGIILVLWGVAAGQTSRVTWSMAGVGGLLYLTVFGSCLAYATYIWLIHQTTPARLATIAYVNPAVATGLGWWILGEELTAPQIAGMVVIILGVAMVAAFGAAGKSVRQDRSATADGGGSRPRGTGISSGPQGP